MKTGAIIQARMNSNRFPGKVLKPILGKSMLMVQLDRLIPSQEIDEIIVATSREGSDDLIVTTLAAQHWYDVYRGSLNDVVSRYYEAAKVSKADIIIRLTGDCPLVWWEYIDEMLREFKRMNYDYMSNGLGKLSNTPDGLDCEIMTFDLLEEIYEKSLEREHLTKYVWFWETVSAFKTACCPLDNLELYNQKLSVDTQEDYEKIKRIFEYNYYNQRRYFGLDELAWTIQKLGGTDGRSLRK